MAVAGDLDPETLTLQPDQQSIDEALLVLDEEDERFAHGSTGCSGISGELAACCR